MANLFRLFAVSLILGLSMFGGLSFGQTNQKRAQAIFTKQNCANCHSIGSVGGCLAPRLDGISSRRSGDFVLSRISSDAKSIKRFASLYPYPELLVHPRLAAADAKLITAFLLKLPADKNGLSGAAHKVSAQAKVEPELGKVSNSTIAAGRELLNSQGCLACHAVGVVGGQFAPRLDGIAKRRSPAYVYDRVRSSEFLKPSGDEYQGKGVLMPPNSLSDEQARQLSAFLLSLPEYR